MNRLPSPRARLVLALLIVPLLAGVAYPLWRLFLRSLANAEGVPVGLDNYRAYFTTPGLASSLSHTLFVGVAVSAIVLVLGYLLALAFTHARVFAGRACFSLALLPLSVPSMFFSIGLIYLFGRQGLLRNDWIGNIYGAGGIVFGEVVYVLPHVVLLLVTTLRGIDHRLYLAARSLGAGRLRRFLTITLPHSRGGLLRAALVAFILSVTDFGIPKVLGGNYSVLSTELYMQIVGMQNLGLGSAIGILLLLPTLLAFAVDYWAMRRFARADGGGAAVFLPPPPAPARDAAATIFAWLAMLLPIAVILTVVVSSCIAFWPYDMAFTLEHYQFENSIYGLKPFLNSLLLSAGAALIGTALVFTGAYLTARTGVGRALPALYRGLAFATMGVPGTVLGLAYVFAFNRPGAPWEWLYHSLFILVFQCVVHFYAVPHLTAAAGFASLDPQYENAGKTLGAGRLATVLRVVLPLRLPVALDIAFYFFINAMTSVSGVVFLFSPDTIPASVAMLHFTDTGNLVEAAAMGTLILAATLLARLGQRAARRFLRFEGR